MNAARQAWAAWKAAGQALTAAVEKQYPVNMIVTAEIGGHTVVGEVIGHGGSYYWEPDRIRIRNVVTGKVRKIGLGNLVEDLP